MKDMIINFLKYMILIGIFKMLIKILNWLNSDPKVYEVIIIVAVYSLIQIRIHL